MKPSTRRVLRKLRTAGRDGATTAELCQPDVGGARFGARIKELRDAGCEIRNRRVRQGSERYWLIGEPEHLDTRSPRAVTPHVDEHAGRLFPAPVRAPSFEESIGG